MLAVCEASGGLSPETEEIQEPKIKPSLTPQWIGGFFEGEGSVYFTGSGVYKYLTVCITQKNPELLVLIHASPLGAGSTMSQSKNGGDRKVWRLYWNGKAAHEFCRNIAPFLVGNEKKEQIAACDEKERIHRELYWSQQ